MLPDIKKRLSRPSCRCGKCPNRGGRELYEEAMNMIEELERGE
jgi:hypothetical protein